MDEGKKKITQYNQNACASDNLTFLLDQIDLVKYDKFKKKVNSYTKLTKKDFVYLYLEIFLGKLPNNLLQCDEKEFYESCHKFIDECSTFDDRNEYLHKVVDHSFTTMKKYIVKLIKEYYYHYEYRYCDYGENMLKCLIFCYYK